MELIDFHSSNHILTKLKLRKNRLEVFKVLKTAVGFDFDQLKILRLLKITVEIFLISSLLKHNKTSNFSIKIHGPRVWKENLDLNSFPNGSRDLKLFSNFTNPVV